MRQDLQKVFKALNIATELEEKWISPVEKTCAKFDINTPKRIAHFLAQMAHESNGFKAMVEHLNYTPEALMKTFNNKKVTRFTTELSLKYGRTKDHPADQVMIASIAYANRMGNGDVASKEGWKFRGRGPGQLTGKDNYHACGTALGLDLIAEPDLVATPEVGALAFGWFWHRGNSTGKSLNIFADIGDVDAISDIVNIGRETKPEGDAFGYQHRLALTKLANGVLA